jgi:hypothetical protein
VLQIHLHQLLVVAGLPQPVLDHPPVLPLALRFWLAALVLGCYGYFYQGGGWNQNSRFALILAVAEQGRLDLGQFANCTGDRAWIGGQWYSDKAPGISLLGLPGYWLVKGLAQVVPWTGSQRLIAGSYVATLLAVAIPAVAGCVALASLLVRLGTSPQRAVGVAAAYGLGTLAWPYATLLYGHQTAAALGLIALEQLVAARCAAAGVASTTATQRGLWPCSRIPAGNEHTPASTSLVSAGPEQHGATRGSSVAIDQQRTHQGDWRLFIVGLLLGMAVLVEYPAALFGLLLIPLAAWLMARPSRLCWLCVGAAMPLLLLVTYQKLVTGAWFQAAYAFSTQAPRRQGVWFGIDPPRTAVVFQLLFAPYRGLLLWSPWLLLAIPGACSWWQRRSVRPFMVGSLLFSLTVLLLNAGLVDWDGGRSCGPRHLVPIVPMLAWLAAGAPVPRWLWWSLVSPSVVLMLAATAVLPEVSPPDTPFLDVILPAVMKGQLALNTQAPWDYLPIAGGPTRAWNLGLLVGLPGWLSVGPLVAWCLCCAAGIRRALIAAAGATASPWHLARQEA